MLNGRYWKRLFLGLHFNSHNKMWSVIGRLRRYVDQGCKNFNVKNNALIIIYKMDNEMQIRYSLLFR